MRREPVQAVQERIYDCSVEKANMRQQRGMYLFTGVTKASAPPSAAGVAMLCDSPPRRGVCSSAAHAASQRIPRNLSHQPYAQAEL